MKAFKDKITGATIIAKNEMVISQYEGDKKRFEPTKLATRSMQKHTGQEATGQPETAETVLKEK